MKENSIETYEAPKVEIIEVEVEKGFATSGGGENGNGLTKEMYEGVSKGG